MTEKFHEELEELKRDVLIMGKLAEEMLADAVTALENQDVELAESLTERKKELLEMDSSIEEEALKLLTLHQPMAKDLRALASILKIITYLTRVGLYGKDIGKITTILANKPPVAKLVNIPEMAHLANEMIDDVLTAFEEEDVSGLEGFDKRDDKVDNMMESVIRECLTYMMEDPHTIKQCSRYMMVAKSLERCADHAVKMAEKTSYMVTGQRSEINGL